MPAHNPVNRNRDFSLHIQVVEKESLERAVDGHVYVKFEWSGGSRSWRIEGVLEPQSPFDDPKHNWNMFESGLPQGQGEAILRLLDWIRGLTPDV